MDVMFIASVSVITPDPQLSRKLYIDALGLPLHPASEGDDYYFADTLDGCKHFGVWPLSQAAEACFGRPEWPADRPVPQLSIEFDVASPEAVNSAAQELAGRGYQLLHSARTEPWGQTVARLQSSEGAVVGVSFVPAMHSAG